MEQYQRHTKKRSKTPQTKPQRSAGGVSRLFSFKILCVFILFHCRVAAGAGGCRTDRASPGGPASGAVGMLEGWQPPAGAPGVCAPLSATRGAVSRLRCSAPLLSRFLPCPHLPLSASSARAFVSPAVRPPTDPAPVSHLL